MYISILYLLASLAVTHTISLCAEWTRLFPFGAIIIIHTIVVVCQHFLPRSVRAHRTSIAKKLRKYSFERQKRSKIIKIIDKYDCHCMFGGCLCTFAWRTKCCSLYLLCSLRQKIGSKKLDDVDSSTVTWRMKANFLCTSFSTRDSCHLKIENRVTLDDADWLTMTTVCRLSLTMCPTQLVVSSVFDDIGEGNRYGTNTQTESFHATE